MFFWCFICINLIVSSSLSDKVLVSYLEDVFTVGDEPGGHLQGGVPVLAAREVLNTKQGYCSKHRVHILVEMKQGQCICPLSWSIHCHFTGDGNSSERGWACTPPPLTSQANFTLMMECMPESCRYHSVYSVVQKIYLYIVSSLCGKEWVLYTLIKK
jgi:hypothetical protein